MTNRQLAILHLYHTINFILRQLQPSPTGLYFYFADIPRPTDFVFPDLKAREIHTAVFTVLVGVSLEHLHHLTVNGNAFLHAVQGEIRPVDGKRNVPTAINRNQRLTVDCPTVADGGRGGQL